MREEELIKYHDKQTIRFEFPVGAMGNERRRGIGILSYSEPHDMFEILEKNYSIGVLTSEMIEQIDYDLQDKLLVLDFIPRR